MSLSLRPARPLTSREIAKIISSQLGGLAEFCDPHDVAEALDHFTEHREEYMRVWEAVHHGGPQAALDEIRRMP